jgi:hypothetical protein
MLAGPAQAQTDEIPTATSAPWLAWHHEQVEGESSRPQAIAFTSEDEPRIAYWRGVDGAFVAKPTPTGWERSGIEDQSRIRDLAIDDNNRVWAAYIQAFPRPNDVRLAHKHLADDTWTIEPVRSGYHVAMTLDGDGTPHLVFKLNHGTDRVFLYHAYRTGPGQFQITELFNDAYSPSAFHDPEMATAPDGSVHTAFYQALNGEITLRHGEYDPDTGQWSFTWLDECGHSSSAGIAVDDHGTIHVACHNDEHGVLHYDRAPGEDTWTWTVAATGDDAIPPRPNERMGQELSVAAGTDTVHITWRTDWNPFCPACPTTPAHLYYTTGNDGDYTTEPADNSGTGIGFEKAIAVDDEDRPWITYEYGWRSRTIPRAELVNPGYETWLAHPASTLPNRAATGAG